MRAATILLLAAATSVALLPGCSDDHNLPARFHEGRIDAPEDLQATYEGDDVVLAWTIDEPAQVLYYIVTVAEGSTGAEVKLTAPGAQQGFTVELDWTDSLYTFRVEAVDAANFVGQSSNVDTVRIPQ